MDAPVDLARLKAAHGGETPSRADWAGRYSQLRAASLALAAPLSPEDQQIQSMPDASPTKWHLAHTAWFFETFLLIPSLGGYQAFDPAFGFLFNSYYEAVGERHARPDRGLITRPTSAEVVAYRAHVDAGMARLIETVREADWPTLRDLIELGLNHEQQHQELILMDIKHAFSRNPLLPTYAAAPLPASAALQPPLDWIAFEGGLIEIGHGGEGFAFDNEEPRHKAWLEPYALADRLVTAGEYRAFVEDGGYAEPTLWLSDGWARVQAEGWRAPLYWRETEDGWRIFTLHGEVPLDPAAPVVHLSHYEADAYARWCGARLPTEAEWEHAAASVMPAPSTELSLHPAAPDASIGLRQMGGEVWEWTASASLPYPGFRTAPGAVGEYNGKFMSGQMVLRGGACVTPPGHSRITYRNFFPPQARWAFSGVRLATDA